MQNTTVSAGFANTDTIQLRFELGTITDAVATNEIPAFESLNEGWIWDNGWAGRVQLSGETFMPLDVYNASDIDPLFDAPGGETGSRIAPIDNQALWTITVNGAEVSLEGFSRKSNILDTATVGWGEYEFRSLQNVFLDLEAPLTEGDEITISFDDPAFTPITFTYAPTEVVSEAIHVNLTGFDPDDITKIAYLSSWNGYSAQTNETVAQVYDGPLGFRVINADSGAVALAGETTLGTPAAQNTDFERSFSLTDVWEMDLSAVTEVGTYYIEVDGVGRSNNFSIDDNVWTDVFTTSFSGFYHQRSGIALEADYTDWVRDRALHPEDGNVIVYASTLTLSETDEGYDQSMPDQFGPLVAGATGEVLPDAWGGWHDAGDWDRRTQHLEASRKLMDLVEMSPDWAESVRAQIPENTNDLPDLLDEALWNLDFFARLQTDEGGVRGGIEGDNYRGYGANSGEEVHPLYAYAPDVWTTWEFAASAAKMSRVIEAYDPVAAAEWLERAERAMEWAEARVPDDIDVTQATSRNLAAAELYATTEDAAWHALFLETSSYTDPDAQLDWNEYQYEAAITYSRLDTADVDTAVAERAFASLQGQADFLLERGRDGSFGFIADPFAPYGWGITASQPNNASDFMVALHNLTGDSRYLEAIEGDVQYALGANPMNMVYMTGIDGVRSPEIILNADADSTGGTPPPGITLYGDYNIYDYGQHFSYQAMWDELFPNAYETPVHESFNGYYLFVPSTEYTVQQGIADMTYVTGYLASIGFDGTAEIPIDQPPTDGAIMDGTQNSDRINGTTGNDEIRGLVGDDTILGGAGNDTLDGGAGADSIDGGAGIDTVTYASATRSVRVDLQNDAFMFGDAVGDTFTNVEIFRAGEGIDQLRGDAGDNIFYGGGSVDRLYGRAGNDFLDGEAGIDAIYGGAGVDMMTGGGGTARDRFIYFNIVESGVGAGNRDVITDFVSGQDRIEISRFDADTTRGFNQAFDFVGTAGFSGQAGELRYFSGGGRTVVQADTNGDRVADFEVELTGTMSLTAADFLL